MQVEAPDFELGEEIVLASQEASGHPDPTLWPPARLRARMRSRQARALGVWLAFVDTRAVGHGLVDRAEAEVWESVSHPEVGEALREGRLVTLGALAVQPGWERRGIARALLEARLAWVARHAGMIAVAEVWEGSPGSLALAEAYGERIGEGEGVALYRYH